MLRRYMVLAGVPLLAATACDKPDNPPPTPVATEAPAAAQNAAPGALGLTEAQLRGADLVDAANKDLGDVEYVVRDAAGAITGLVIEIDDTEPDRFVQIPLDGLEAVHRGDDWDVRSKLTRDALMALPEVSAS